MKHSITYATILSLICSCALEQDHVKQSLNSDLVEITLFIKENFKHFQNDDDKIPRVLYTTSLNHSIFSDNPYDGFEFIDLLKSNDIKKMYISSKKEIWYVMKEEKSFFKTKEYLIGHSNLDKIESAKIGYYKISDIDKIDDSWYAVTLTRHVID